jgi:hypothetical protein
VTEISAPIHSIVQPVALNSMIDTGYEKHLDGPFKWFKIGKLCILKMIKNIMEK